MGVSSSSSFLDFAAFQARSLGLSSKYQLWVCWYFQSGVSDFLFYVASFFPHLSVDASRNFSSGSSLFLSALHSLASALPSAPPPSSGAPVFPPVSVPFPAASLSVSAPPPAVLLHASFSSAYPHPPVSTPLPSAPPVGISAPSVRPPPGFSASAASSFPSVAPTVPLPDPSPAPSVPSSFSLRPSALTLPAFPGVAAPAVPVAVPAVPEAPATPFRPFAVSGSSEPSVSCLAPFAAPAAVPDFASGVPLLPPQSPVSSAAPSVSVFIGSAEDHLDLGYPDAVPSDPEVPLPDSFPAEIRRMYAYLGGLFPQAAGAPSVDPPPHALFEEFFTLASTRQQPIYLNWFTRVHMALAETDTRLAAFLASGRMDFAFLPSRSSQYAVRGEFAQGSAASVNPLLLAFFECPLRPTP